MVEKVGFMRVFSDLEPLHRLSAVPEGCKATFFPYSGVSASQWGEGLQWRTQLSLQTLLNVPHWGTTTALTRSRLSTRSLLDVCHRHTATEPTGETAGANCSPLRFGCKAQKAMAFLAHCSAPTEPTGETVAGRAPPGHSNRADRRERQGVNAIRKFAKF